MARLAVDGTKSIYFEDLGGTGRALIMIHGWGMDNRCWDGVILPLPGAAFTEEPHGLSAYFDNLLQSSSLGSLPKEFSLTIAGRRTVGFALGYRVAL